MTTRARMLVWPGLNAFNAGLCGNDAVCGLCPCSCEGDPGCPVVTDPCPHDANDDADSDGLCADVDSCPIDSANDSDSDAVCDSIDSCPLDVENDVDSDLLCRSADSCPLDFRNDADGDRICDNVDPCDDLTGVGDCPTTTTTEMSDTTSGDTSTAFAFGLTQEAVIGICVAAFVVLVVIIVVIVVVCCKNNNSDNNDTHP